MKARAKKVAGPKPRTVPKKAAKVCGAGHRQGSWWKPGDYCSSCAMEQAAREGAAAAARERRAAMLELGPAPEELVMRDHAGNVVAVASIPRGLRPKRRLGSRYRRH